MGLITNRRGFLTGLGSLLMAPAVCKASLLMPVSALHIPKRKFVYAIGEQAGTMVELAGTAPSWALPCDGRLVNGLKHPELFKAVRGYAPRHADEWVHIWHEDCHELNTVQTVDYSQPVPPVFWEPEVVSNAMEKFYG